jgi:hypothetical protein
MKPVAAFTLAACFALGSCTSRPSSDGDNIAQNVAPPSVDRRDLADLALPDRGRYRDPRCHACGPRNSAPAARLSGTIGNET